MKYAVIKDGIVENVIEWNGMEMIVGLAGADFVQSQTAQIGDRYENGAFINKAVTEQADVEKV